MIDQLAKDLSQYRLKKANDLLSQAILLCDNQKYDGSINRSYYAILNAIRAVLALLDLDSSKHSGVLSYFDRYLVKTTIFDKKFSQIAHTAFDSRQDYDYEDFSEPNSNEALNQINEAEVFIREVETKVIQIINNEISISDLELP